MNVVDYSYVETISKYMKSKRHAYWCKSLIRRGKEFAINLYIYDFEADELIINSFTLFLRNSYFSNSQHSKKWKGVIDQKTRTCVSKPIL